MDIAQEIAKKVEQLPPVLQERVLRYVASLSDETPVKGQSGAAFLQFVGTLDSVSAKGMREAIEEGCEQIDASEW